MVHHCHYEILSLDLSWASSVQFTSL